MVDGELKKKNQEIMVIKKGVKVVEKIIKKQYQKKLNI